MEVGYEGPDAGEALQHEFGAGSTVETPFMRQGLSGARRELRTALRSAVDGKTMTVSPAGALDVGGTLAGGITESAAAAGLTIGAAKARLPVPEL